MKARLHPALPALATGALGGCARAASHSPTVDVLGSYFPSWMVCILAGVLCATILRLLLIGIGLHEYLRFRTPVYLCLATICATVVWLLFYRN